MCKMLLMKMPAKSTDSGDEDNKSDTTSVQFEVVDAAEVTSEESIETAEDDGSIIAPEEIPSANQNNESSTNFHQTTLGRFAVELHRTLNRDQ